MLKHCLCYNFSFVYYYIYTPKNKCKSLIVWVTKVCILCPINCTTLSFYLVDRYYWLQLINMILCILDHSNVPNPPVLLTRGFFLLDFPLVHQEDDYDDIHSLRYNISEETFHYMKEDNKKLMIVLILLWTYNEILSSHLSTFPKPFFISPCRWHP